MSRSMSNFLWIFANLLFAIIGMAFMEYDKFYYLLALLGGLQLLLAIYIDVKSEKSLFNALVLYEVVMYLFLYGQCLMWIITEDYSGRNIIDRYNIDLIEKAQIFTLVSLFFFHLGLFAARPRNSKSLSEDRIAQLKSTMYFCGKVLFCITVIPEIVYNVRIFIIAQTFGYAGIYDVQTSTIMRVFLNLREFFFPAIVMLLCGDTKKNKLLRNIIVCIILSDALVSLYVGSRSDAMMQILSLVFILQTVNGNGEKTKKQVWLKYIILLVVLVITANVVRVIRIMPNRSISTFFEYLFVNKSEAGSDNMIVGLFGELGGTMATLLETMILVPASYNHLYGSSYLYALTWLLPGFITNNVWEKASMNNWIDTVRYTGSGWGFSTTAEAYFNFGYLGVLVFLLIGYVIGKLFKRLDRSYLERNPVEFALSFVLFNRLLIFSRIDFLSTLPSIVYFYFCLKIFIYLVDYVNRVKGG